MRSEVYALPELFLNRLKHTVPVGKWDQIANTFAEDKPTTLRVNTLKATAEVVREALEHAGFRLRPVSWCRGAFILTDGRLRDLQETSHYRDGLIYVQNLSSMIPPLVLDPKPGECVLDLTAAPGSKTTQMASLMRGEGEIVAVECNRIRYEKLKANLKIQGAAIARPMLSYGESIGKKFPERFDRVLLDAPCSAESRFEAKQPSTYRYWTLRKVKDMARLQIKLLASAVLALREGGALVYSTCSFAPEENEGVIHEALERFGNAIELVGAIHELPLRSLSNRMAGLTAWEDRKFNSELRGSVRILPTSEMEGFFIARIRKKRK